MEMVITKDNFQEEVLESDIPVLLDFWAEWCGPCTMLAPVLKKIDEEYAGRVAVGKVNIDYERELAFAFKVESIPLVLAFKDGKVVDSSLGYNPVKVAAMAEDLAK